MSSAKEIESSAGSRGSGGEFLANALPADAGEPVGRGAIPRDRACEPLRDRAAGSDSRRIALRPPRDSQPALGVRARALPDALARDRTPALSATRPRSRRRRPDGAAQAHFDEEAHHASGARADRAVGSQHLRAHCARSPSRQEAANSRQGVPGHPAGGAEQALRDALPAEAPTPEDRSATASGSSSSHGSCRGGSWKSSTEVPSGASGKGDRAAAGSYSLRGSGAGETCAEGLAARARIRGSSALAGC